MSERVLVLAEVAGGGLTGLTRELLGLGMELASGSGGTLEAFILGDGIGPAASELASGGAAKVHAADDPALGTYDPDLYLEVLRGALDGREPFTLVAGHTPLGQDLMPRLAFSIPAGLVTDCVGIEASGPDGSPVFVKPVFGGNALASCVVKSPGKLATVRARVGRPAGSAPGAGEVVPLEIPSLEPRVRTLDRVSESAGVRLEDSRVVVSGGRGMGGEEGFAALEELAGVLGGAVGASRPPCDSGWVNSAAQVGITGKIVAPDLYFAVAISGSSQHLSGMSESGKIVAVNQDPDAFIFKVSDYGVAADWKQVLPALTEELRKLAD